MDLLDSLSAVSRNISDVSIKWLVVAKPQSAVVISRNSIDKTMEKRKELILKSNILVHQVS